MKLISLIGEQPIPNLLPILYLWPQEVVLIHTSTTKTATERIADIARARIGCRIDVLETDPYDIAMQLQAIRQAATGKVIFNITGGTKMMSLAAYEVAGHEGADFVYLQSERGETKLLRYGFDTGAPALKSSEAIPELIKIDDYLRAHCSGYEVRGFSKDERGALTDGGLFERSVHAVLSKHFEVLAGVAPKGAGNQIEIDLVIRRANTVGIAELKLGGSGDRPKQGIDQLNTAAGREYLGTKTVKFLILANRLNRGNRELAKARNVIVIELNEYVLGSALTPSDAQLLTNEVRKGLSS